MQPRKQTTSIYSQQGSMNAREQVFLCGSAALYSIKVKAKKEEKRIIEASSSCAPLLHSSTSSSFPQRPKNDERNTLKE
jgi:hypothetical protein